MNCVEYTKLIINEFIEHPMETVVEEIKEDSNKTIVITPHSKSDAAKLIGKNGKNISALRVLVRAANNAHEGGTLHITVKDHFPTE